MFPCPQPKEAIVGSKLRKKLPEDFMKRWITY